MSRHFLPCILCCFFSLTLSAQSDYQLFRPGVQYLFENEVEFDVIQAGVLGMRVETSDCFTTYRSLKYDEETQCYAVAPSFAGDRVCQGADSTIFWQEDGKNVLLFPRAAVGASWPAWTSPGLTVFARVDSVRWTSFLGISDSVKYFSFRAENAEGETVRLSVDTLSLAIGKRHGLVNGLWFRDFPFVGKPLPLIGLSDPEVGMQNPELEDIFQLQVGDDLHVLIDIETYYRLREYQKGAITAVIRDTAANTIQYRYQGEKLVIFSGELPGQTPVWDTSLQKLDTVLHFELNRLRYLDRQPGEVVAVDEEFGERKLAVIDLDRRPFCERSAKRYLEPVFPVGENCYVRYFDVTPGEYYADGLAGPYYYRFDLPGIFQRHLRFYRQGADSCGTAFDFTTIVATDEPAAPLDWRLAPNPTPDKFTIQVQREEPVVATLFDLNGRPIDSPRRFSGNQEWNISTLAAGVYILRLQSYSGGKLTWIRVIKQ